MPWTRETVLIDEPVVGGIGERMTVWLFCIGRQSEEEFTENSWV